MLQRAGLHLLSFILCKGHAKRLLRHKLCISPIKPPHIEKTSSPPRFGYWELFPTPPLIGQSLGWYFPMSFFLSPIVFARSAGNGRSLGTPPKRALRRIHSH